MNRLWWRQIQGILRIEVRKNLFSGRALPLYLLALIPLALVALFVTVSVLVDAPPSDFDGAGGAQLLFGLMFRMGIVRSTLYFACVWVFMNLFRGEVLDRSLHYYFLAPVRREVLVAGKFLSAWVGSIVVFSAVTTVCFVTLYSFLDPGPSASVVGHLLAYLSIVVMATLGYGAIFMVAGLFLRNPVIPAILIFFWEGANPFLPGLLKKFSVIFYMQAFYPVDMSQGPIEILAEPVSVWIAVPGFLIFSAAMLVLAGLQIRRMEVHYADD